MDKEDGKFWVWIFLSGCALLLCILGWVYVFGPLFNHVDYNNYNTSPQHLQAIAGKFSDDCQQIAESQNDPGAVKAIEQDIYQTAKGVDLNAVEMPSGVRSCVTKAMNDATSK
jgi:hypothetical protein